MRIVLDGVRSTDAEPHESYALPMPSWRVLGDEDLAAIVTYVRQTWGGDATPVSPQTVARVRQATEGRSHPWTRAELGSIVSAGDRREPQR